MTGWNKKHYLRAGLAAAAVALAVSVVVPASSAMASSTHDPSSQNESAKHLRTDAKQKSTGSSPGGSASQVGGGAAPAPAAPARPQSKKDKAPDRGPHKATPQKRTTAGQSSSDRARSNKNRNKARHDTGQRAPAQPMPGWDAQFRQLLTQLLSGMNPQRLPTLPPRFYTDCDATTCTITPALPAWERFMPPPRWVGDTPVTIPRGECTDTTCTISPALLDPPGSGPLLVPRTDR
jgi:hypothetical protein